MTSSNPERDWLRNVRRGGLRAEARRDANHERCGQLNAVSSSVLHAQMTVAALRTKHLDFPCARD